MSVQTWEDVLLHWQRTWSILCLAQTVLYVYSLLKLICQPLGSRRRWCTSSWPCGCLLESKSGFLRIILLFLFGHNSSEAADSLQIWHQRSVSPEAILQECKVRFLDFYFFFSTGILWGGQNLFYLRGFAFMVLGLSWNNQQHPGKIGGHAVSHADSPWAVVFYTSLYQSVSLHLIFGLQDLRGELGNSESDCSVLARCPGRGQRGTALGHLGGYCSVISVNTKADNSDTICQWLKHRKMQNCMELSHFCSSWFQWECYNEPRKLSACRFKMHKRESLFLHSIIIKSWNSLSYQVKMVKSKKAVTNRLDKFMDDRTAGVY